MRLLPLMMLIACTEEPASPVPGADGTADVEARTCPDWRSGTITIEVGEQQRTLEVELPDDAEGAGVLVAWHWLGGDATQTLDWMGVRDLADEGFIVVAPESSGAPFEWDFEHTGDDNADLALFDAVVGCLSQELAVREDRVFTTGMSAGGLMTTWLAMHRSEALAGAAPFSGGAGPEHYTRPVDDIPVMVTWGGPDDTYGGYDFAVASSSFADQLEADGHVVAVCEHDGGHLPPWEAVDMLSTFLHDHAKGEDSPWAGGLPGDLPTFCR